MKDVRIWGSFEEKRVPEWSRERSGRRELDVGVVDSRRNVNIVVEREVRTQKLTEFVHQSVESNIESRWGCSGPRRAGGGRRKT